MGCERPPDGAHAEARIECVRQFPSQHTAALPVDDCTEIGVAACTGTYVMSIAQTWFGRATSRLRNRYGKTRWPGWRISRCTRLRLSSWPWRRNQRVIWRDPNNGYARYVSSMMRINARFSSASGSGLARERLGQLRGNPLLPLAHLHRVDFVLRRDGVHRLDALQGSERDLGFELGIMADVVSWTCGSFGFEVGNDDPSRPILGVTSYRGDIAVWCCRKRLQIPKSEICRQNVLSAPWP